MVIKYFHIYKRIIKKVLELKTYIQNMSAHVCGYRKGCLSEKTKRSMNEGEET